MLAAMRQFDTIDPTDYLIPGEDIAGILSPALVIFRNVNFILSPIIADNKRWSPMLPAWMDEAPQKLTESGRIPH